MKITVWLLVCLKVCVSCLNAQSVSSAIKWIRPSKNTDAPVWGIRNGIVVALWPAAIEPKINGTEGGPRGLLRIGYDYMDVDYLVNFIAVEPVVNDDMEFSEISPSVVDDKPGKLFWAADSVSNNRFSANTSPQGIITHPDSLHPDVEQLSFYVFMEKFISGAHPYLKISIRSDNPGEVCLQIFNEMNSTTMQRCALTATMGNYSRLRLLYLKDETIDAGKLYHGYNDIDFIEKDTYSYNRMLRNKNGDYIAVAESNESFLQLADWPQQPNYIKKWGWRYRPFYKLTQYWRKEAADIDSSLTVRVNGRAKYWAGESNNVQDYISIPNGPAFENFELRENYHEGEKFYFGLSTQTVKQLIDSF